MRTRLFPRFLAVVLALGTAASSFGYVEIPMPLSDIIRQSTNVCIMQVTKVDKAQALIVYTKVRDLKGTHPTQTVRHVIKGELRAGECKEIMDWAEPGKTAIFFHNGGASETCIDNNWYQAYPQGNMELWSMSHGEPFLLRSFAGKADKLPPLVTGLIEGKELLVPCMVDDKPKLQNKTARVQRLKNSMKILDYNPKRDFVGWGGEDIRRVDGLGGFSHVGALGRVDAEARSVSAIDFDGDGKLDVCLVSTSSVRLYQNQGDSYSEVTLPGLKGGARSAVWGDYNGDGKPDLLLATGDGAKLFTNLGGGQFRDDSGLLPRDVAGVTAAAWIDADGDGKPDILLATAFNGLRLYRNNRPADAATKFAPPKWGDWMLIGPFDNTAGRGFDTAYPPEKEIDFAKQYDGKNKEKAAWRKMDFKESTINNLAIFPKAELNTDAVAYVARTVEVTAATEIPLSLGSDDALAVFVNGERVLAENAQRAAAADQNRVVIKLKPGKNTVLLKITQGYGEWAFYFAAGPPTVSAATGWFVDVTAAWGLGTETARGESLGVADVNADGRPDFLYGAGTGMLFVNTGQRFDLKADSGLSFDPTRVGPTFVDFNGDGRPDVFVPQAGKCKLYRNDGTGKFTDVTDKAGDLAKPIVGATSAAWGDFNNDGHLDVVIGCLRGANRYFQNNGDGTFSDKSAEVGLTQRIYNTQAVALADLNGDGKLDLILGNEGQDSVMLFGDKALPGKGVPLVVHVPGEAFGTSASVRVTGKGVQLARAVSGGEGRGQANLTPRFILPAGTYQVEVRDGTGKSQTKEVTLADSPMKVRFDDKVVPPKK